MNIRHGDIALIGIDKLPEGLTQSVDDISGIIFSAGSGGHTHSHKGGRFFSKVEGDFVIGYLEAKNTTLFHPEHGKGDGPLKECSIEDGFYEVRRQVEYTPEGLKVVVD